MLRLSAKFKVAMAAAPALRWLLRKETTESAALVSVQGRARAPEGIRHAIEAGAPLELWRLKQESSYRAVNKR
ncbi:hypothetical protein JZ751_027266 [Albula glossodonta]|uniref:Uncharacterized protein n=1 Tax=Albula glossodonta TaxID=121402 RepID=A0A8T2MNX4_9TELE|nr:hypothetical protein JZ751_027266 [Albula glossodonta]